MPSKTVTVPLGSAELRQESYDKLIKSAGGDSSALSHRIQIYLELTADGALLLKPGDISEIEKATSKPVRNARDVVQAATKSGGIEDGEWTVRFSIDPAWHGPLAERAQEVGRPVRELLRDTVDHILENNWLYGLEFEGARRTFSPKDEKFFVERLGQDFSVADIRKKFSDLEKSAVAEVTK